MYAYCLLFSFSHIMQPGTTAKILKEDSEPATFWNLLGGKKTHPNYREPKEAGKDPHLFTCSLLKGMFVINMSNMSHFPSYQNLSDLLNSCVLHHGQIYNILEYRETGG